MPPDLVRGCSSSRTGPVAERSILPLRADQVSYEKHGHTLLKGVSFTLTAGPCTIVLGPNGSGKSLLLRLCHGLIEPTRGWIQWQGPEAARAAWRQAMVFQHPVLLRRSAAANIAYALKLRGVPKSQRTARVEQVLEMTGLLPLRDRYARVLSGGEQQRLALARAWATQPEVLFLDEPTANLDPAATRTIEELINVFHDLGIKIVMTTHDLAQARRLADEVLFLHQGRLVEQGSAREFFQLTRTAEAQAFIRGELLW